MGGGELSRVPPPPSTPPWFRLDFTTYGTKPMGAASRFVSTWLSHKQHSRFAAVGTAFFVGLKGQPERFSFLSKPF